MFEEKEKRLAWLEPGEQDRELKEVRSEIVDSRLNTYEVQIHVVNVVVKKRKC